MNKITYTRKFRFSVKSSMVDEFKLSLLAIFVESALRDLVFDGEEGSRVKICTFRVCLKKTECLRSILDLRKKNAEQKLKILLDNIAADIDLAVFGAPLEDFSRVAA